MVKQLLLYPNSVSVPLMPNFGVTPEPQGMVRITLSRIEGLKSTDLLTKGDPYVVFTVRFQGAMKCREWMHSEGRLSHTQVSERESYLHTPTLTYTYSDHVHSHATLEVHVHCLEMV